MKRLFSQLHRPLRNERGEITFFACFFVVGVVMLISFLLLSQAELPPMLRESSLNAAAIVFLSMGRRCKWKRMVLLDTTM